MLIIDAWWLVVVTPGGASALSASRPTGDPRVGQQLPAKQQPILGKEVSQGSIQCQICVEVSTDHLVCPEVYHWGAGEQSIQIQFTKSLTSEIDLFINLIMQVMAQMKIVELAPTIFGKRIEIIQIALDGLHSSIPSYQYE